MSNNILISVIVPIYKAEKYLVKCLNSLVCQTFKDMDIVLVDDGSPDNCPRICDNYALAYNNIQVIHKQNEGVVNARKDGLTIARGKYICYVDADDWVDDTHFEIIANAIIKSEADIIMFGFTSVQDEVSTKSSKYLKRDVYNKEFIEKDIIPTMISSKPFYTFGIAPSLWSKAFKREILLKVSNSVPKLLTQGEDAVITYPAIIESNTISAIDEYGYMYRINDSSMTMSYDSKLSTNIVLLLDHLTSWAYNTLYSDYLIPQLQDYARYMFRNAFYNEITSTLSTSEILCKLKPVLNNSFIMEAVNKKETPFRIRLIYMILKSNCCVGVFAFRRYLQIKEKRCRSQKKFTLA